MREIKFRVWERDTDEKQTPIEMRYCQDFIECASVYENYGNLSVWMQFTGLYDKNGKEIYEEDIVKGNRTPDQPIRGGYFGIKAAEKAFEYRRIRFTITDWRVNLELPKDISYSERIPENQIQWEVIGNSFENPELLELLNESKL